MDLLLACGHTQKVRPREDWLRVIRLGCMRCRMEAKMVRELLLVGGPQNGKRARVGGTRPALLLEVVEKVAGNYPSLLEGPETVARWNEQAEWYEVVRAVGCTRCGGSGGIPSGPFGGARDVCPDCGGRGSTDVLLH